MKVKSIRHSGKADVFNMVVDDTHNFVIDGGVVSHNCDSMRYMCMYRPIPPRDIKSNTKPYYDPLNQFK